MVPIARSLERFWGNPSELSSISDLQLLVRTGKAAQGEGDYSLAITQFESAIAKFPYSEDIFEIYLNALREVEISQFLINQFYEDLGWSPKEYRGTDHILSNLSGNEVSHRLNEVTKQIPKGSPLASRFEIVSKIDIFARGGLIEGNSGLSQSDDSSPESHLDFIEGLVALKDENNELAVSLLSSFVKSNPHWGLGYLSLALALYRQGRGGEVLDYMNLALLYPSDTWIDIKCNIDEVIHLGKFDGFRIIFFKSELHAFPEDGRYFISLMNGHNEVFEHALSPSFRGKLLECLPEIIVTIIRKCVYSSPLRYLVARPAPLSQFLHGKNISDILSVIRRTKENYSLSS